jgi:sensor histidine kinase regulating citrate/malate metabolism
LYIALIAVTAAAIVVMIQRIISTRKVPLFILLFLILPVGQFLTLYSLRYDSWSIYRIAGILLGMGAVVLLLVYNISHEKTTAAREQLKETRHMMELERSHYEAVEQRREELTKIRRDFHSRLETVAEYARSGEDDTARGMIAALAEKIDSTKEKPYCDVPVINAVLTEKSLESVAEGIELEVDLNWSSALAVEPMHLCSIFSNILDNAINACKNTDSGGKDTGTDAEQRTKPVIRLSSMADGDYLFIKTVNPSSEPAKKALPGHGYGSRILTELAHRYGGDYRTDYKDGVFTAFVSLLATVAQQSAEAVT